MWWFTPGGNTRWDLFWQAYYANPYLHMAVVLGGIALAVTVLFLIAKVALRTGSR